MLNELAKFRIYLIRVIRLLYCISGKYKDECKHKSENLPISILTSPPKTRQLPTWMSNADIPENNDSAVLRTCSSKGTIMQVTDRLQPNVITPKLDSHSNDIKANCDNGSRSDNQAMALFLKKWSWAIGPIDDFGDKANVISNTICDKPQPKLNKEKGEFKKVLNNKIFHFLLKLVQLFKKFEKCTKLMSY